MGQKVYLIQAKKISFVETGKSAEYSYLWVQESRISLVSISKITSHSNLSSETVQACLCLTWWETPKTAFLVRQLICLISVKNEAIDQI